MTRCVAAGSCNWSVDDADDVDELALLNLSSSSANFSAVVGCLSGEAAVEFRDFLGARSVLFALYSRILSVSCFGLVDLRSAGGEAAASGLRGCCWVNRNVRNCSGGFVGMFGFGSSCGCCGGAGICCAGGGVGFLCTGGVWSRC